MEPEITNEEYFGELKLMFQSKGWKYLMMDLQQNAQVVNNLQVTKDERDLDFRRGQLAVLGYLINLEYSLGQTEQEANADEGSEWL